MEGIKNKKLGTKHYLLWIGIIILLALLLYVCVGSKKKAENEGDNYYGTEMKVVPLEQDFYEAIEENPIDKTFMLQDLGTEERISVASDYAAAWTEEIENTLLILEEYLDEEDFSLVSSSYEHWKQYIEDTGELEKDLFYIGGKYEQAQGGSLYYSRVMVVRAARIREYAIEIKSIEYALTGKVEFVYSDLRDLGERIDGGSPKQVIENEIERESEVLLENYRIETANSRSTVYYCPDNYTYAYQIFDKDGAVLAEEANITGSVFVEEFADGIVRVAISAGSYARNEVFYDTETGEKSEVFYNVATVYKRKVAYMDLREQESCLIIRDIFDKDLYYKEIYRDFSPSAVPSTVLQSAVFVEDSIIQITYLEGEDYVEKEEKIEL